MSWWKEAVIYQIYPRSFYDSNGDGVGDLQGVIQKLDYLNGKEDSLGIDAIWFSPIYPSPMFDFGYDISDYENIDPVFGDLKTFKLLLKEAHKRKIKIIMDLVINHTSHLHPWFIESRSSRNNKKRDWYIWKDPVKGKEPNKWLASFGGKAWEFDEKTGQYYYHHFLKEQPDLNWRNPEVKKAIFKMIRYWLDMGVDGFRLDVVNYYIKDSELRNNPVNIFKGPRPYDWQYHIYDRNRPENFKIVQEFRTLLDSYKDKMSVGEVFYEPPGNPELSASYCGENNDGLHLAFNFAFMYCKWNPNDFLQAILEWEKALKNTIWPNYTLSNHDQPRHFYRYFKKGESTQRAKIIAAMLLTLRGTPFLYYGEEIGMTCERVPRKKIQDPIGKKYWPFHPGRDGTRLPMCWDSSDKAGFTSGEPWLPLVWNHKEVNLENQINDTDSLFSFYKKLIRVRKKSKALTKGSFEPLDKKADNLLSYIRTFGKEKILVVLNFKNTTVRFLLENKPISVDNCEILISTHRKEGTYVNPAFLDIFPYEASIIRLE
ncbi:MAG: alpha-glucosidase [Leptospiraceae bacterium]|nr:alpha-glucosidase [Leptospiraceae bacterium]MCK6381312.1 alpha-glucosidase [Leptospiraceae bacterium]NUM40791.1 alpha-glucosidase [Leptospiraceae bacterium]